MTNKSSSNIYIFYGEDDFSLRRKIDRWKSEFAKKYTGSSIYTMDGEGMDENAITSKLGENLSPSLFSSKKLIIARNVLPTKATQTKLAEFFLNLPEAMPKDFFLVIWETKKPDKRSGFVKKFLNMVTVQEFTLPHGYELNSWIKLIAKEAAVAISDRATEKLAVFLGRDLFEEKKVAGRVVERKEQFNLWEVHTELSKLACYSANIQESDVEKLVQPKVPENIFILTDELASKNRAGAMKIVENLLTKENTDEKAAVIKIIGLLSEQIRSFVMVSNLLAQKLSNDEIAENLGWTSGRVFITARNLRGMDPKKPEVLLDHLVKIDIKLKSSDDNPKLLLDMFLNHAAA